MLWGIRDLQFYDEFQGSSTEFSKLVISLSKTAVNIVILIGGEEYSIAYSNNYFNHFPDYLNNYDLPFEDRTYLNNLLLTEKEILDKGDITVVWGNAGIQIFGLTEEHENSYKGKYYIYEPQLGIYSFEGNNGQFLPYEKEDWLNLLQYGYHFESEELAKEFLENQIKPYIKDSGGKIGDLQILSSARVYSEVLKIKSSNSKI